jgi:hypothetical protein
MYKISRMSGRADSLCPLFGIVYLASSNFVMDPTKEQNKILCKSQKYDEDPGND